MTDFLYPTNIALGINFAATIMLFICTFCSGIVYSFIKHRPYIVLIIGNIIIMSCVIPFFSSLSYITYTNMTIFLLILTAVIGMTNSMQAVVMADLYPAKLRFSGISFSYNVASCVSGGICPFAVTGLTSILGTTVAPAYAIICISFIGIFMSIFFPYCSYRASKFL